MVNEVVVISKILRNITYVTISMLQRYIFSVYVVRISA